MTLTVGSLFAGIGGFDLGFERAGFEVTWQVEIDPFCNQVLTKHWPATKRYRDVKNCRGWITSSADFPVKTSAPPADARDLPEVSRACIANSFDSWTKSDREVSLSRTCITVGAGGCPNCDAPCGRSDMPLCRFACAPAILGPGMNAAACSSWPTLTNQSYGSNRGGASGRTGKIRLSLPTLIRRDARTEKGAARMPGSIGSDPLLPTLTRCGNYNRKGASPTSGDGLATALGGRLNPTWCEWYMGFPLGWTDVG